MSSESKGDEEGEDRALIEKEDGTIEKSDGALDLGLGDGNSLNCHVHA